MHKKLSAHVFVFVLMVSLSVFLNACAKKVVRDEGLLPIEEPQVSESMESGQEREARLREEELNKQSKRGESVLREEILRKGEAAKREVQARKDIENVDIHFDFDKFFLMDEARAILADKASWLLDNPGIKIKIEGHCDDRGTTEYNMALGERRADSAKKYLVNAGVGVHRISTISYGEEMPLDPGQNEAAWAKNRRAHLLLLSD